MLIYHVATRADWETAVRSGSYATSTYGVTLAQEGFIHASREDQWRGVLERFYADVREPLVLLVIQTDRLASPVVEESPPGTSETFPHVYGPVEARAVVEVRPLSGSFTATLMTEIAVNVGLLLLVMAGAGLGVGAGRLAGGTVAPWVGLVVGLAAGLAAARVIHRRRG